MFCINCGNRLKENDKFCKNCGNRVGTSESKSSKNNNKLAGNLIGLIVFIFAFVVVAAIVRAFITGSFMSTPTEEQYRKNFMENCNRSSNGRTDYCNCFYNKMSTSYTLQERIKMENDYKTTKTFPDMINNMANYCSSINS